MTRAFNTTNCPTCEGTGESSRFGWPCRTCGGDGEIFTADSPAAHDLLVAFATALCAVNEAHTVMQDALSLLPAGDSFDEAWLAVAKAFGREGLTPAVVLAARIVTARAHGGPMQREAWTAMCRVLAALGEAFAGEGGAVIKTYWNGPSRDRNAAQHAPWEVR